MSNSVISRSKCWYGDETVHYEFPDNWDIKVLAPGKAKVLTDDEISQRILYPIGSHPLKSILDSKKKVLIISDDISRPTRTDIIIPILLNILTDCGIEKEYISILISTGTHDRMTENEKLLKFGKDIVKNIRIIDHDFLGKNKYIGDSRQSTPIYVNNHLLENDLIIGVGGIYPHNQVGFGGGAKLILGVCGYKTIKHLHSNRKGASTGEDVSNEFRQDLLDIARMAKMDFIVNTLVNTNRDITNVFAGDVNECYETGIREAKKMYAVPSPKELEFDLVIADVYPADSSIAFTRKGWWPVHHCLNGTLRLVISASPKGLGNHPLFPIVPNRFQSLKNLAYEWQTSNLIDFFNSTVIRKTTKVAKKITNKLKGKIKNNPPSGIKSNAGTIHLSNSKITFLYSKEVNFKGQKTPGYLELANDFDDYINRIRIITNNRPLRVGFYQACGLSFPENNKL